MNFWRLQCFVALAEVKHFGRAANRLYISQPALSGQIRQLEETFGVELFVRHPQVALTQAGEQLYPRALRILELVNETMRTIAVEGAGISGSLRLLYTRSISAEETFDLIEAFREYAPGVTIETQTMWTADSVEKIRAGLVDAAFVRLPIAGLGSLEVLPLGEDEQRIVLRREHPLAQMEGARAEDLATYPLVHWPRDDGPGYHDDLLEQFAGGVMLERGAVQPDLSHRLAAVARSDGYALVHENQTHTLPETLTWLPVLPTAPTSRWGLVWDGAASHEGARIARVLATFIENHITSST